MPDIKQMSASRARQALYRALRAYFLERGYDEVETPALVPRPGMEPHIAAFEVPFVPQMGAGAEAILYLHTSPEYAMKRLLADGAGPIFQICKAFRNGEISEAHNPEFSLLEFYRPQVDYRAIMRELEEALARADAALSAGGLFARTPYQRMTVAEAFAEHAGIDLSTIHSVEAFKEAALSAGVAEAAGAQTYEDVFFHVFLQRIEVRLGRKVPTFLCEYPAPLASLARLSPQNPAVAERFELYAAGRELANGFSELTDAAEQRRRLVEEQEQRRRAGLPAYPLDETFLQALSRMPTCAGVAVGLDRILMLLLGAESIEEVLLFPARDFWRGC